MINSRSQAVAATAVGVSWLTAGIATGGLVIAGTLVAAGVTVGSMGGKLSLAGGGGQGCACVRFYVKGAVGVCVWKRRREVVRYW